MTNTTHANVLIIDTATEACSVALRTDADVYHQFEVCPQQQSQRILPMVKQVCEQAGITIQQVNAIGFGQGPGSFTGVRIAIGTVQGLALGLDVPVVGVSTLAAMAQQAIEQNIQSDSDDVLVAIDARMSEVYFAHYRKSKDQNERIELVGEEQVLSPELASNYAATVPGCNFAGTGWEAYPALLAVLNSKQLQVTLPDALYMQNEVMHKLTEGIVDSAESVAPVYLRDTVTWKKLPGRE